MDADSARDGHERLDMTVTAQDRVVGDDDPVVDHAIVGDVHVDHQQVVRADPGDALLFFAAAVDGHAFADDVMVADLDAGGAAAERNVLRLAADDAKGWMMLSSPSVVMPWMQAWAIRRVPRPILTSGPMTQ